jgi:hypothetical protein
MDMVFRFLSTSSRNFEFWLSRNLQKCSRSYTFYTGRAGCREVFFGVATLLLFIEVSESACARPPRDRPWRMRGCGSMFAGTLGHAAASLGEWATHLLA